MRTTVLALALLGCGTPVDPITASIDPANPTTEADLHVVVDGSVPDPQFTWFRDGAEAGITADTVPADQTARGELWTVLVASGDMNPGYAAVRIGDTVPVVTAAIEPAAPVSTDTLTCVGSGTDLDGDAILWEYTWSVNGEVVGTASTLDPQAFRADDVATCSVVGIGLGGRSIAASAEVTIDATLPVIATVALDPVDPTVADVVSAIVTSTDPHAEPIELTYAWTVDGIAAGTGPTLDLAAYARGAAIEVEVTPTDPHGTGLPVTATAVIANAAPMLAFELSPLPVGFGDVVTAALDASDADGDALTFTYEWTRNGQPAGSGASPTGDLLRGTDIGVRITADDGIDSTVTSAFVTVANSPPTLTDVHLSPNTPDQNDTVECTANGLADVDRDGTTITYDWIVNGVRYSTNQSYNFPASVATVGDTIQCIATPYDDEAGPSLASNVVTVTDAPPVAGDVWVSHNGATTDGESIWCYHGVGTDRDDVLGEPVVGWEEDGVAFSVGSRLDSVQTRVGHSYACVVTWDDGYEAVSGRSEAVDVVLSVDAIAAADASVRIERASNLPASPIAAIHYVYGDMLEVANPDHATRYVSMPITDPQPASDYDVQTTAKFTPTSPRSFGETLVTIGDFNGDGVQEYAMSDADSSFGATRGGAVYVMNGALTSNLVPANGLVNFYGGANDYAGHSIAGLGDFDGDGLIDVVAGSGHASNNDGHIWLFYGRSTGTWPRTDLSGPVGLATSAGASVAGAGDVDGDGYSDLLFGAPGANADDGQVWLVLGDGTRPSGDASLIADAILDGDVPGMGLGETVAGGGDLNGDGLPDLVAMTNQRVTTAPFEVLVIPGTVRGVLDARSEAFSVITADQADAAPGTVVYAADLDQDGLSELMLGVPAFDANTTDDGVVAIFRGPLLTDRLVSEADTLIVGEARGDGFGAFLTAGDFLADGSVNDLAVSSSATGSFGYEGTIYAFYGM